MRRFRSSANTCSSSTRRIFGFFSPAPSGLEGELSPREFTAGSMRSFFQKCADGVSRMSHKSGYLSSHASTAGIYILRRCPMLGGMPSNARILVVDDDAAMRATVRLCLESAGYRILECTDGAKALETVQSEQPALIVLDVMMPNLDGLSTAQELRRVGVTTPVLMLTTRSEIPQKVAGLEAGADDYLAKPFDRRELLARVQALLRREERQNRTRRVLRFGEIEVNLESRSATKSGVPLSLTRTEFSLLELLAKNLGAPVTRNQMMDSVWGYTYFPESRTVDTHIWRLRKKLGDDGDAPRWIRNVQGQGYVLLQPEEEEGGGGKAKA
ncbi:DNA-binding response regulator [Opitutaceae bacterium EW11]|nr:DNA-binding response regulator [Opitutaceae bacterium EW11]